MEKKPKFKSYVPKGIPEGMRNEYLKYIKDKTKYKIQYPVSYEILSKILEGLKDGSKEKK